MRTRVLTWEHKHGREMYDASTDEALEKSARKVLKTLLSWGYIYKPGDEPDLRYSNIDMELVGLADEQVNALPTESLRDEARKHKKRYDRAVREHAQEVREYEEATTLATGGEVWDRNRPPRSDGTPRPDVQVTAWQVLGGRNGAEYELFDLDYIEGADDDDD